MREPYYLFIAFMLGFVAAQVTKFVLTLLLIENRGRKWSVKELWWELTRSGGMPSGHAAAMSAATTVALMGTLSSGALGGMWPGGLDLSGSSATVLFVLLCMDAIVFYDAMHVRFAVGEQGKALNKLLKKNGEPEVKVVEGHTFGQVVAGVILGIAVGYLTLLIAQKIGMPMPWYGG